MGTFGWRMGLCITLTSLLPAQGANQAAYLLKARQAYYSLSRERMDQIQADLVPNWRLVLDEQKVPEDTLKLAVEKLNGIRFTLTVNRKGGASITHTTVAADNDQMAAGLKQIYDGMEQMTVGFFDTWSPYMVTPPLPEVGTPFQLEEVGVWTTLSYKEGDAKVETTLGKDYAVSVMKVTTPAFNSTISPRFTKSPKGLVLIGYQATYRTAASADATDLTVSIENQEVDGLTLPKKMDLRGSYGASPFHVEVTFRQARTRKY